MRVVRRRCAQCLTRRSITITSTRFALTRNWCATAIFFCVSLNNRLRRIESIFFRRTLHCNTRCPRNKSLTNSLRRTVFYYYFVSNFCRFWVTNSFPSLPGRVVIPLLLQFALEVTDTELDNWHRPRGFFTTNTRGEGQWQKVI